MLFSIEDGRLIKIDPVFLEVVSPNAAIPTGDTRPHRRSDRLDCNVSAANIEDLLFLEITALNYCISKKGLLQNLLKLFVGF